MTSVWMYVNTREVHRPRLIYINGLVKITPWLKSRPEITFGCLSHHCGQVP
jgi:hypothetical protein